MEALTPWIASVMAWQAWFAQYEGWVWYGIAGVCVLLLSLGFVARRHPRPTTEMHGGARFATRQDIRRAGLLQHRAHGIVLGRVGRQAIRAPLEMSALAIGPAGSGKSRGIIMPTLRSWPASAVVLDMSGELLDATYEARRGYGPVGVLALTEADSPDAVNPLDRIRYRTVDEDADARGVAQHLRPYDQVTGSQGALYYRDQALNLLTCGFLVVGYPEESKRVMGRAYPRTCRGVLGMLADAPLRVTERLQEWAQIRHETIHLYTQLLLKNGPPEQRDIWQAAINWLLPWQNPVLVRNTSTTTLPLDCLQHGPYPVTLYLRAPVQDVRGWLGRIVRLIVEQVLLAATRHREYSYRWPQLVVLDDMEALGGMSIIQDIPAHYRKYGVTLLGAVQSLGQLWEHFGHETSLLDNCRAVAVFRPENPESAEFMSRKLGRQTIMERRETQTWGRGRTRSRTDVAVGEALLDPGAIMRLQEQHLVCVSGLTILARGA